MLLPHFIQVSFFFFPKNSCLSTSYLFILYSSSLFQRANIFLNLKDYEQMLSEFASLVSIFPKEILFLFSAILSPFFSMFFVLKIITHVWI